MSQVRTYESKTKSFIREVRFNFLRSSTHLNCDTVSAATVFFLKKSIHAFINLRNRGYKPGSRQLILTFLNVFN